MKENDTIAAIATGMTNSGIGIVRISGDDAIKIADEVYHGKTSLRNAKSHTIHYGYIVDGEEIVDETLVMLMHAPKTYTGENTVEINCHGGLYVVQRVLETVIKYGARLAEPGEFTKRAFLNGKMDLSQAEAVSDVIQSENDYALKNSISQLKGSIKNKIIDIRNQIIYQTAYIESALDDPEHIDMDGYGEKLSIIVDHLSSEILYLIRTADNGRMIKEGIQTVILGKPNAGKSSFLNILSGKDRAIVTDIEGTTRDILEEHIRLNGLCLNVIDTAGIRYTEDIIERIGVEKAKKYAKDADLLLYVVDSSKALDQNDYEIMDMILGHKSIILLNKSDLTVVVTRNKIQSEMRKRAKNQKMIFSDEGDFLIPMLEISAKKEVGIDEFEKLLFQMFFEDSFVMNHEVCISNIRQKDALKSAYDSLQKVAESIKKKLPEDFYSIDLMDAYEALGHITGETTGEDLIHEIFSKFCMGK